MADGKKLYRCIKPSDLVTANGQGGQKNMASNKKPEFTRAR